MSNSQTPINHNRFKINLFVILNCLLTILGLIYLFIHHQTLKDLETKTNQPNISDETTLMAQRLELLEEKINHQTLSNPINNHKLFH